MNRLAYNEWVSIFDSDISKMWTQEMKELQRCSMLMRALQKELERVQNNLNMEVLALRRKLKTRDKLKRRVTSIQCLPEENKESEYELDLDQISPRSHGHNNLDSPDLFNDIVYLGSSQPFLEKNDNDGVCVTGLDSSPTLSKSKKHLKRKKCDQLKPISNEIKEDIFDVPKFEDDMVITCTPEARSPVVDRKASNSVIKKTRKHVKDAPLSPVVSNSGIIGRKEQEYYDGSTEMAISDILLDINSDSNHENESCNESTCSINMFSKGGFLDESDIMSPMRNKCTAVLEPIGAERKELVGFTCRKCRTFYTKDKLEEGAFKKRCCKQNCQYKDPEETVAGFWDLTFSSQVEEVRK